MQPLDPQGPALPPLRSLVRDPDGASVWSSHRGKHVRWDLAGRRAVAGQAGDEGTLLVGGAGRWLVTCGHGELVVRERAGGDEAKRVAVADVSGSVFVEREDAAAVIAGDPYGTVAVVTYAGWEVERRQLAPPESRTTVFEKEPGDTDVYPPVSTPVTKIGKLLRADRDVMLCWRNDLGCLAWIAATEGESKTLPVGGINVDAAALSPDGNRCVLASTDGAFTIVDLPGGAIRQSRPRRAEAVTARLIGNYPAIKQIAWADDGLWWLTPGWLFHTDPAGEATRGLRLTTSGLCVLPLPELAGCAIGSMDGSLRIVERAAMPAV